MAFHLECKGGDGNVVHNQNGPSFGMSEMARVHHRIERKWVVIVENCQHAEGGKLC